MFGKSFFAAGAMLSLVALPLVVATVREGLQAIPNHVREASYAVGKTKIATIRRVLLPAARPSVITGHMLGIGHVIGDTAIIVLLLGDTQTLQGVGHVPLLGILRGTGSTLTSYIFDNAPTGDLNQPNKAYAAAFVLLLIVLALNLDRRRLRAPVQGAAMELSKPPPVRRLSPGGDASPARPAPPDRSGAAAARHGNGNGNGTDAASSFVAARRPARSAGADDRPHAGGGAVDRLRLQAGRQVGLAADPPGRGAGADRPFGVRQDDAAALAQPAHRADQDGVADRADHARRDRHRHAGADRAAPPRDDGLPAAEPVPDERVRQRRLRPARAGQAPAAARGAARRRSRTRWRAPGLLEEVADNLDHPALRLSGGQQQRLCIARALAAQPEVLLLDEPCSALDPQSTEVIEDLIVKLREEVAVVIVTHNLQQAYRIADHVGFMYLGELVEYGSAAALFGNPSQQRTKDYVSGAFG